MAREFGGDEFCGGGMPREVGQRRLALGYAGVLVSLPHQALRAGLMRVGVEYKSAGRAELALAAGKGPAGDDARQRCHVVLAVAAADAERMQLHDFAREILVQAALAVWSRARLRTQRLLVVEKEQHRRMLLDGFQHVAEPAEHMGPDRLALECAGPHPRQPGFVGGNAKMVGPEH